MIALIAMIETALVNNVQLVRLKEFLREGVSEGIFVSLPSNSGAIACVAYDR